MTDDKKKTEHQEEKSTPARARGEAHEAAAGPTLARPIAMGAGARTSDVPPRRTDSADRFELLIRFLLTHRAGSGGPSLNPGAGPNQRIQLIAHYMDVVDDVYDLGELRWGPDGSPSKVDAKIKELARATLDAPIVQPRPSEAPCSACGHASIYHTGKGATCEVKNDKGAVCQCPGLPR